MSAKINNRKDVLLLLLYSPGQTGELNEPIAGRTRLTKLLFLFKKEVLSRFKKNTDITDDNFYEFFAWNFGPFSKEVYDDLTFFEIRGFIHRSSSGGETAPEDAAETLAWLGSQDQDSEDNVAIDEYAEEKFTLTKKGENWTKENLYKNLSVEQKRVLSEFKKRLARAPLRSILHYVYSNYEDFTDKSVIKDEILGG